MQSAISRFVGSGNRQDFYNRLARTAPQNLPSANGVVTITHETQSGTVTTL